LSAHFFAITARLDAFDHDLGRLPLARGRTPVSRLTPTDSAVAPLIIDGTGVQGTSYLIIDGTADAGRLGPGFRGNEEDRRTTASRSSHCGPCAPVARSGRELSARAAHNANETKLYPSIGDASGSPARAIPTGRNQTLQVDLDVKRSVTRAGRVIATRSGRGGLRARCDPPSKPHQGAGHPARFPTRRTFSRAAASRSLSRLAVKNRPNKRRVRSLSRRARQRSALIPSRAKIPASSAEIVAFPVRNSRPV
jgi:hypothetical protein